MSLSSTSARAGTAAFALALALGGPLAAGIAGADTEGAVSPDSAGTASPSRADAARAGTVRTPRPAPTAKRSARPAQAIAASGDTPAPPAPARRGAARVSTPDRPSRSSPNPAPATAATALPAGPAGDTGEAVTRPDIAATPPATVLPAARPSALTVAAVPSAAADASPVADIFVNLFGPIQSLIEGVVLLVRRTFFNQAPTVDPVQLTGQSAGPITGTLGASDPEGDPLTFELIDTPRHGEVAIGADGDFIYTPGPDFTGRDSFNVAVTDGGFHINLLDPFRPASTEAYVQVAQNAVQAMLTFAFSYGSGSQYWSTAARDALEYSAERLAAYFVITSPITITYSVTAENAPLSSTLASAASDLSDTGAGFFTTVVQEKILTGIDVNGPAADGEIDWNFGNPWAFGASVSSSQYDFVSTAMHELVHSFGFLSYTYEAGNNTGRDWAVFDQYMVTSTGTRVISDSTYRWNTAYDANLTGGNGGLYFGGPNAVAAYGGYVPLYTPKPWEEGSSTSHLDDDTFTGSDTQLMNAVTDSGLGIRVLSPIELGILKDIGYTVTDSPVYAFVVLVGVGFLRRNRRR